MPGGVLTEEMQEFLSRNEFISLGTCGFDMQPVVTSKMLLKIEDDYIYLGDYNIDKTLVNIYHNSKVSLSCIDLETLTGYQINGIAKALGEGKEKEHLFALFTKKKMSLSATRIIDGVRKQKQHKSYEVEFPEEVVVYKIRVREIIAVRPGGTLDIKKP